MSRDCSTFVPVYGLLVLAFSCLLQLLTLTTAWWATFSARTDLGKPKEDGHYGLWSLCTTKGPHWIEDCDPLDTFFTRPPYAEVAGAMAIAHLLILLISLPLGLLRSFQCCKNHKGTLFCLLRVSLFVSVLLSILVAIFASLDEQISEYSVKKSWSFWIQISVIVSDLLIMLLLVFETFRSWKEHVQRNVDTEGKRAETYGNPTFHSDSPDLTQRRNLGALACTEASGQPYVQPFSLDGEPPKNVVLGTKDNLSVDSIQTLTFENQSYQERSPSSRRLRS